jgi:hypothetical protein
MFLCQCCFGDYPDRCSHVCGLGASVPLVASVQVGVRVERVIGCWVWKARVGRTCDCFSQPAIPQGVLVGCFCYNSGPPGKTCLHIPDFN